MMKKIFIILIALGNIVFLKAQLNVLSNTDATQLAQKLAGIGVSINNATLVCPSMGSGTFTNAPAGLGIPEGVVLATGDVLDVPNDPSVFISTGTNNNSDVDLDNLLANLGETYTTNDACVLEFDITVIGDTLSFNYVMGSEEYPSFVCSSVNDIFGFFITGPNPAGGTYNNQNVALIPNTTIPVSINTVNNGSNLSSAVTCYDGTYSTFFNGAIPGIAYNGNTVALQAIAPTVPCGTYHFKLALGDGGDNVFDSGVFLEAGSFSSTGVLVSTSSILGAGFTTMVEGCVDGSISFELENGPNLTGVPYPIPLSYSGSATVNSDYLPLPDTVWIAPGDSTVSITVTGIDDAINEPLEQIDISIVYPCGAVQVASLDISDVIPVDIISSGNNVCNSDTISLKISGATNFIWYAPTGLVTPNTGDTVIYIPTQSETLKVFYTLGTCTEFTDIPVLVSNLTASLNPTPISCPGFNDGAISIATANSLGTINYAWSNGSTTNSISNLSPDMYSVTVSDDACVIDLEYDMINPATVEAVISTNDPLSDNIIEGCINAEIVYTLVNGPNTTGNPFPVLIDFGGTAIEGTDYDMMPDTVWIADGQSSVTLNINSIADGNVENFESIIALITFPCGNYPSDTIQIQDEIALNLFVSDTVICPGKFVLLSANFNLNLHWAPEDLFFNPNSNFVSFITDTNVLITLSYTVGTCDFTKNIPIVVEPLVFDVTVNNVNCPGLDNGSIVLDLTSGQTPITYNWDNLDTTSTISNLSPGTYIINAFDNKFCPYIDTFEIIEEAIDIVINPDDYTICKNQSLHFELETNLDDNATYLWKPSELFGDSTEKNPTTLALTESATFSVQGSNSTCGKIVTIDIVVENLEIEADNSEITVGAGAETAVGVVVVNQSNIQYPINYEWTPIDYLASTNEQNTTTTPQENIDYTIYANSEKCSDTAKISVFVGIDFEMPDAFSPNGDGINDVFNAVVRGGEIVEFRVYNRWGKMVHDDASKGWDGYVNGKLQAIDSYSYYIKLSNKLETKEAFGNVTLLK